MTQSSFSAALLNVQEFEVIVDKEITKKIELSEFSANRVRKKERRNIEP